MTGAMAAVTLRVVTLLASVIGQIGHRTVHRSFGQPGQWSVLAFQHHGVNGVYHSVNQQVTQSTRKDVHDDRVLQAEAEGARGREVSESGPASSYQCMCNQ